MLRLMLALLPFYEHGGGQKAWQVRDDKTLNTVLCFNPQLLN